MAYPLGTEVQLSGSFVSTSGAPTNPTAVTLYVKQPGTAAVQSYTGAALGHPSTGVYTYSILLNVPGQWLYCWEGTGSVEAATFDIPLNVSSSALRSS